jgi:hypothetical protein
VSIDAAEIAGKDGGKERAWQSTCYPRAKSRSRAAATIPTGAACSCACRARARPGSTDTPARAAGAGNSAWAVASASIELAGVSLRRARRKAGGAEDLLERGVDPIDTKRAERSAARKAEADKKAGSKINATTLLRFARAYHEKHVEPLRADRHGKEWLGSIERHVPAAVLDKPIAAVTAIDLRLPKCGLRNTRQADTDVALAPPATVIDTRARCHSAKSA